MDGDRFDDLSRKLAGGLSRRGAVKGALAGVLGALGLRGAAAAQVSQAYCGNVVCKGNPCACRPGCACCLYSNGNSRCRPPGACRPGTEQNCPPATTTTTTPAPTMTTTTGQPSNNCTAEKEICLGDGSSCNDIVGCFCFARYGGGFLCGAGGGLCTACTSDADCVAVLGEGSGCAVLPAGGQCISCVESDGRFCVNRCPAI